MKRKKTTQKPACPNCRARIKRLYYIVHQSVSGEFTLAAGHEDNLCPDQKSIEYYCPECNVELFDKQELAEAFLLGTIARPILLEGQGAKPVEGQENN